MAGAGSRLGVTALLALAVAAGLFACSGDARHATRTGAGATAPIEPLSPSELALMKRRTLPDQGPVLSPSPRRLLAGVGEDRRNAFAQPEDRPPSDTVLLDLQRPRLEIEPDHPMQRFLAKLRGLEDGTRSEPVVILHVGDSHIASDSFSRGIRQRLQARFGDAGRGPVIPANAFQYAAAQSVSLGASGGWNAAMSLKSAGGVYGVSGVRVEAGSPAAVMRLKSEQPFDVASVTVVTGPGRGDFTVEVDGHSRRFSSAAASSGARTFRVDLAGRELSVRPAGNGKVSILHWSTERSRPGIRYVNFGQVGATVDVTKRWNEAALQNDLETIRPDLIVYGFGTNEGFNDNVDPVQYRDYAAAFLGKLQAWAPNSAVAVIGAADGLRRRSGDACGNGWVSPSKLDAIRDAMRELAGRIDAFWWDWSQAMGGPCSIDRWSRDGLAAKDRVHLTAKGYDRSAAMFYEALTAPLDASKQLASAN